MLGVRDSVNAKALSLLCASSCGFYLATVPSHINSISTSGEDGDLGPQAAVQLPVKLLQAQDHLHHLGLFIRAGVLRAGPGSPCGHDPHAGFSRPVLSVCSGGQEQLLQVLLQVQS